MTESERRSPSRSEAIPQREARKGLLGSLAVSLLFDRAYAKGRPERIDSKMTQKLQQNFRPHPKAGEDSYVDKYAVTYPEVRLWHGTGRYQYDKNSEVSDVLASICERGRLTPALDEYDIMSGPMVSTSLARSRMYARAYADIHGSGTHESNRYGSAGFWGTYIGSRIPFDAAIESKPWRKSSRDSIRSNLENRQSLPWGAKVHRGFVRDGLGNVSYKGVFTPFYTGSDIQRNYPVLIGIKQISAEIPIARSIARHEVRIQDELSLDVLSHMEVPYDRVQETKSLFERYDADIPVFPIETGEVYCSGLSFAELVYPNTQKGEETRDEI